MTVSSQTSKVSYSGNGSTKTFTVPFYFLSNTQIQVIKLNTMTNVETVLVLSTDYTVSGAGNQSGGSITTTVAPTAAETITIVRNVPYTQETDYQPNDPFPAASHEMALDKLTMECQQLKEAVDRSVKVSVTSPTSPDQLANEIDRLYASADNIDTVAGDIDNVNAVAPHVAAIDIAASNIAGIESFADIYQGAKSAAPTTRNDGSPLLAGDLYFNTVSQLLYVFNGAVWNASSTPTPITINTQLFSGNGSTTTFTLTNAPAFPAACEVFIAGVAQRLVTDFNVSGAGLTTLTFVTAPPSGTNNIFVRVMSSYNTASGLGQVQKTINGVSPANVQARLFSDVIGDVISIKDFGAIGDGAHGAADTAAFQLAANSGTRVYLPPGSYILNSTITFSTPGTSFIGAGVDATFIQSTFASGDVFNVTGGWIKFEGMSFSTSVIRTSGSTVNFAGIGPSRSLKDFGISGGYIGVSLNGTLDELSNGSVRDTVPGNGMAIQVGDSASGFNQLIENVITDAPFTTLASTINASATTIPLTDASGFASSGVVTIEWEQISYTGKSGNNLTGATRGYNSTTAASHNSGKSSFAAPLTGLRLFRTYDIRVVGCEFQHNIHGCYVSPGSGQLAYAGYFDSCYFDSSSWAALTVLPTGTGIANLCRFDACWFGNTATGDGVFIGAANIQGTHFNQCQVISNGRYGYYLASADDTSIIGGRVEGSGDHGINAYTGLTRFNIVGVTSASNRNWGIYIGSGCDYFNVTNCVVYSNTNGSIQDASGADHQNLTLNVCDSTYNTRGIGHNANDVTGSRNLSLNAGSAYYYANNRPYPMFVCVQLSFTGAGGFISQAVIGNSYPSGTKVGTIGTDYGGSSLLSHSFIVPPNSSYYVTKSVAGVSVVSWVEYI